MNDYEELKNLFFDEEFNEKMSKLKTNEKELNIFNAVGMVSQEIRHSNFLAWLFENDSKFLYNSLLDEFLRKTISVTENQIKNSGYPIEKSKIELLKDYIMFKEKKSIEVKREFKDIDLFIVDKENETVICIENKVDALESEKQLRKYFDITNMYYKGYKKFFIFLTKDGIEPKSDDDKKEYFLVTYSEIFEILKKILKKNKEKLNTEIKMLIENYIDLLIKEEIVMSDSNDIKKLCSEIWDKYEDKLNILLKHQPNFGVITKEILEEIEKSKEIININKNARTDFSYMPVKLNEKIIKDYNSDGNSIGFNIFVRDNKVIWHLYKNENFKGVKAEEFYKKIDGQQFNGQIINTKNKKFDSQRSALLENSEWINIKTTSTNEMKQKIEDFINESIKFSKEILDII